MIVALAIYIPTHLGSRLAQLLIAAAFAVCELTHFLLVGGFEATASAHEVVATPVLSPPGGAPRALRPWQWPADILIRGTKVNISIEFRLREDFGDPHQRRPNNGCIWFRVFCMSRWV